MKNSLLTGHVVLANVRVWSSLRPIQCVDIEIESGIIKRLGPNIGGPATNSRFEGLDVLPLGVDSQVHLRVPGQPEKEEALSGLTAARAGGFGAVLSMPNTRPVIDSADILVQARREVAQAEQDTGVKAFFTGSLTMGLNGAQPVDFESLMKKGVTHFTDDGVGVADDTVMEKIFSESQSLGFQILQHAEMPGHKGVLAPGPAQISLSVKPYFEDAEVSMVRRDIELLKKYPKAKYHVLHISSAKTVALVREARNLGLNVSGEVSPHHLLFNVNDIDPQDSSFKMNPPIRTLEDQNSLVESLSEGTLSFLATDHAPHEQKMKGSNFTNAAFGTTGLEASLRVALLFYKMEKFSSERVCSIFSSGPAEFLGISEEFGEFNVGKPLRAVIFDSNAPAEKISQDELYSKSGNTCFKSKPLPGKIKATIIGNSLWEL